MVFCGTVESGRTFELKEKELHAARGQYKSTPILWCLRILKPTQDFLLAITEADLYADGLNFVFGEAYLAARCAIISLATGQVESRISGKALYCRTIFTPGAGRSGA